MLLCQLVETYALAQNRGLLRYYQPRLLSNFHVKCYSNVLQLVHYVVAFGCSVWPSSAFNKIYARPLSFNHGAFSLISHLALSKAEVRI